MKRPQGHPVKLQKILIDVMILTGSLFLLLMLAGWGFAVVHGAYRSGLEAAIGFFIFAFPLVLLIRCAFRRGS